MKLEALFNGRVVPFLFMVALGLALGYFTGRSEGGFMRSGRGVILLIVIFVFAIVLLDRIFGPFLDRRKINRFQDRGRITPDQFYDTFYSNSGLSRQTVLQLLDEVAESIRIPAGLLRPQDRFEVELADEKWYWPDWGLDELSENASTRLKKLEAAVEADKIKTVDDYIRTFGSLETQQRARAS